MRHVRPLRVDVARESAIEEIEGLAFQSRNLFNAMIACPSLGDAVVRYRDDAHPIKENSPAWRGNHGFQTPGLLYPTQVNAPNGSSVRATTWGYVPRYQQWIVVHLVSQVASRQCSGMTVNRVHVQSVQVEQTPINDLFVVCGRRPSEVLIGFHKIFELLQAHAKDPRFDPTILATLV